MAFEHCNKNRAIFERKTSVYFKVFRGYKSGQYNLEFAVPFQYLEYVMLNSVRSTMKILPNEVLNIFKEEADLL